MNQRKKVNRHNLYRVPELLGDDPDIAGTLFIQDNCLDRNPVSFPFHCG